MKYDDFRERTHYLTKMVQSLSPAARRKAKLFIKQLAIQDVSSIDLRKLIEREDHDTIQIRKALSDSHQFDAG
jgi:hypothetical protein